MNTKLPEPLAAYFSAVNDGDVPRMLAPFAEDAFVKDEGKTRSGRAAVHEWIEEVTAKHHPSFAVEDVAADYADAITVVGLVSGTFPGSPIRLRYAFQLAAGKITHLEIRTV